MIRAALAVAGWLISAGASAGTTAPPSPAPDRTPRVIDVSQPLPFADGYPKRTTAPGGEVTVSSAGEQRAYDEIKFAPARRVGDTLYISGVIAGAPGEGGVDAFRRSLRLAFRGLERTLKANGATFDDMVMINSFHVFESPKVPGGTQGHFQVVAAVKDEFMRAPHPAWTAVGTSGLLSPDGLVEIQMIAHVPQQR